MGYYLKLQCFVAVCLILGTEILGSDFQIYVSPSGSDTNDGLSSSSSLLTIAAALPKVLAEDSTGNNVFIELMPGYHDLHSTITFNHLYKAKVTIRAYQGGEVHVTGGKRLPGNLLKNVTDANILHRLSPHAKQHVKVIHLPDAGITNYGKINEYGFYTLRAAPLEIFWNGEPTRLARYPNQGFLNIVHLLDGQNGTRFSYAEERHLTNWTQENEIWTYGYWYYSWADKSVKVAHIDTSNHTVTLEKPPSYGLRIGHYANTGPGQGFAFQGGYFKFFNILGELDEPTIDKKYVLKVYPETEKLHKRINLHRSDWMTKKLYRNPVA